MSADGPVILCAEREFSNYGLDLETLTLQALGPTSMNTWHVASFPDGRLLVENDDSLVEIDRCSDSRRTLYPAIPAP
jgi:hypothetical protein